MDPPDPRAVELSIKVCCIMKHWGNWYPSS
jgi:hypothetical protein